MSDPTGPDIYEAITSWLVSHGRLPKANELSSLFPGMPASRAQGMIASYTKDKVQRLIVLPDGKIRTWDGEVIWNQNSKGSLVLACFRKDKTLGNVISG